MGVLQGANQGGNTYFRDTIMSPAAGITPWANFPSLALDCDIGAGYAVSDDFSTASTVASTGLWKVTKGTGGSIVTRTSAPVVGGWIDIPTAASASDYQIFSTQNAMFGAYSGLDMCFEVAIQVTEAATNVSSWFAGFTSTITSGFIQTSGAPAASYSGFVIWKATGAMAVKCQTSNVTTKTTSATLATAVSGTTLIVGAYLNHNDNVTANVTPYVCTVASNARTLVTIGASQNLTLASLSAMYFAFGGMCGSGGTAETFSFDYARAAQGRYYQ